MMTFTQAAERIERAATFDALSDGDAEATYRAYAKVVHPDAVTDTQSAAATRAFARLARLYRERGRRLAVGDVADLLTDEGGTLVKIPRDPADSDLMEAEAAALRTLHEQ